MRGRRLGVVASVGLLTTMAGWLTGPAFGSAPGAPPGCGSASTSSVIDHADVPIADNATALSTMTVGGIGGYILDVDVVTDISHTFSGDLEVSLLSPDLTPVVLTTDNGGSADDVFAGTLWDDDGGDTNPPGPVSDATFVSGVAETPLVPEGAFGAVVGEDPNGIWRLEVGDDASGDIGTMRSWRLDVTTLPSAPRLVKRAFSTSPALAIPDNTPAGVDSTIDVAGTGLYVHDVDVVVDIPHTFSADVDATLTSPAGTEVTLTTDNGSGDDDLFAGKRFDDHAPTPVTDGPTANRVAPEEAFGAFAGEDPNGTWTLNVADDAVGDVGSLDSWSLIVTGAYCGPPNCTVFGTNGNDVINGGPGPQRICGLGGDDVLRGGGGNDTLIGGPGDDTLIGQAGGDRMLGQGGRDTIRGGSGSDIGFGGSGRDLLAGSGGNDRLSGGGQPDTLRGGAGDDLLDGGPGADSCFPGPGSDQLVSC